MLPISMVALYSNVLSSGLRIVFSQISVLPDAPAIGSRESYNEAMVYHVELFEPGVQIALGNFVVGPENFDELESAATSLSRGEARAIEWNTLGAGAHTMKVQLTAGAGTGEHISFHVFLENGKTDSRYDVTLVVSEASLKSFAAALRSTGRRK